MKTQKLLFGAIIVAVLFSAFMILSRNKDEDAYDMAIPNDAMFADAVSAEENQEFTVTFLVDDSSAPVSAQGLEWKTIRWELSVYPKEGVEVTDFYCTLVLDGWILERSSSPDLKYMGIGKGHAGDIPADIRGVEATMEKLIPAQSADDPMYEAYITAPAKIMLSYNGQEMYYFVTPVRKQA